MNELELRNMKIDEENPDVQEKYFYMMDKIIDAATFLRYEESRESHIFASSAQLYDRMIATFSKVHENNKNSQIKVLAQRYVEATKRYEQRKRYCDILDQFYHIYKQKGYVPKKVTSPIFNEILNKQKDEFCRLEKSRISNTLKRSLDLTKKKQNQIVRSRKLKKMNELFQSGKYEEMGLTGEKIEKIESQVYEYAKNMKYFRKNHIAMPEELPYQIGYLFFIGAIPKEVDDLELSVPSQVVKQICNQYYKKMLPFLDTILEEEKPIIKDEIDYHYNHFVIASNKQYQHVLTQVLSDDVISILEKKENQEFLKLLPLCGLLYEFEIDDMKNILKQSTSILERLKRDHPGFQGSLDEILNHFASVLQLSQVYSHTTPLVTSILGEDAVTKILNNDPLFLSRNPRDYLEIYPEMLKRSKTKIPTVSGTFHDYTFESGKMSDRERLLYSSYSSLSCLGPKGTGEVAFYQSLMGEYTDVLMIKDKDENFVARSLLFRRGNYIMMSSIVGKMELQREFYQNEFLSMIAKQLLDTAQKAGDDLSYVFITEDSSMKLYDYLLVIDEELVKGLPHVDWSYSAYLIGGEEENICLRKGDFGMFYPQTREKICSKEEIKKEDILRMDALNMFMTGKKEKANPTPNLEEYIKFYKGQDWYLGIKEDGNDTFLMLPTNDERQKIEIEMIRNQIYEERNTASFVKVKK